MSCTCQHERFRPHEMLIVIKVCDKITSCSGGLEQVFFLAVNTHGWRTFAHRSEDWKGTGWYRITGGAGTQLADFEVHENHCGTHATGWMAGGHPTVSQGEVTRTVNFNSEHGAWKTRIRVINCYTHYVYYLKDMPTCSLGYCTA